MKTDRKLLNYAQKVTFRHSDFQPEDLDINWYTIHKYFYIVNYEGWNFNSGNYLFTTDTK